VVVAAKNAGALGARLSGGGFGGSAIAMVRSTEIAQISEKIIDACLPEGLEPEIVAVVPSSGAEVLD